MCILISIGCKLVAISLPLSLSLSLFYVFNLFLRLATRFYSFIKKILYVLARGWILLRFIAGQNHLQINTEWHNFAWLDCLTIQLSKFVILVWISWICLMFRWYFLLLKLFYLRIVWILSLVWEGWKRLNFSSFKSWVVSTFNFFIVDLWKNDLPFDYSLKVSQY